jgi:hypothetical protein
MGAPSRRRPTWIVSGLAFLLALTVVAGLGAGGQQAAGATRPASAITNRRPTKDEFVDRVARLCDARQRARASLGVPFTSPPDYARRGPDLIRVERRFDKAVGALAKPVDHRLFDRAYAEYHRYLHLLPALVTAAQHRETRAWLIMYDTQAHEGNAGTTVRRYAGRNICNN